MYSIVELSPSESSGNIWEAYNNFLKERTNYQFEINELKLLVQQKLNRNGSKYRLIFEDAHIIMSIHCTLKPTKNGQEIPYITFENIRLANSVRLLKYITKSIFEIMQFPGINSFVAITDDLIIKDILTKSKSKIINAINYYSLSRNTYNSYYLNQLSENDFLAVNKLAVQICEYVPENLYNSFSDLMTGLMNDIIRDNDWALFGETTNGLAKKIDQFKIENIKMLVCLLFDEFQKMIGLSFMLVYPNTNVAKQELTGIKEQYRRKKISTFLKATITKEVFLRYHHIDKIETNCYSSNYPIVKINQALGYSLIKTNSEFMGNIDDLNEVVFDN